MTTQQVQEKLYDRKSLFTLSGAAGAVWLLCLVIANLDQDHKMLSVTVYKFIALAMSMALAVYMVLRDKRKTRKENYLFAFFNGLLIFVNASGINAISSNVAKLASEPSNDSAWVSEGFKTYEAQFLAISFFVNDVDWWPNAKQEQRIKELEEKLSRYNTIEDTITVVDTVTIEDPIRKEYLVYKEETQKHIEDQQTVIDSIDKEFITYKDRAKEQFDRMRQILEDCLEKTKPNENGITRDQKGTNQSTKQVAADLQLCNKKLEVYMGLYTTVSTDLIKVKDSLKKCQKRYQID
jgi:hypothetical protein